MTGKGIDLFLSKPPQLFDPEITLHPLDFSAQRKSGGRRHPLGEKDTIEVIGLMLYNASQ